MLPPLGLMSVGAGLKEQGHEVVIYDGEIEHVPLGYKYYGFGPTIAEYNYALKVKNTIKSVNPDAKVIIGGPHATLNYKQCLCDGFDCVVCGDGEYAAEKAFLTDDLVLHPPELPLDEYPFPDRDLLDLKGYTYCLNGIRATTLLTARGCPFKCAFCCKNHKSVRLRSVESVNSEIEMLHYDYGFNALIFPEDLFIVERTRSESIMALLKDLNITWRCLVRGDLIVKYGEDFIHTMVDSGCVDVGIGIESGSNKILSAVNKGESIETIEKAVNMLKDSGLRVKGFFVLGLPGESYDTISETNKFLGRTKLHDVDIKIYQPYPGTPIWDNKDDYDIGWKDNPDLDNMFYKGRKGEYGGSVFTAALSNKQIYDSWMLMESTYKNA